MSYTVWAADHTGLTVADLEAAVEFWRDVVGLTLIRRGHLDGDFAADVTGVPGAVIDTAVLAGAGHRVELLRYIEPAEQTPAAARPCDPGAAHLAFTVDGLDELTAAARPHGWTPAGTPRMLDTGPRAGYRFAYLRHRDGTTLELVEPPAR